MAVKISNPLSRYASEKMATNFTDDAKFGGWRKVWAAQARSMAAVAPDIVSPLAAAQIAGTSKAAIDYERVRAIEKEKKHDVVAHKTHLEEQIRAAFGEDAPGAKVVHIGFTSRDVTDNAELSQYKDASMILRNKAINTLDTLVKKAEEHKDLLCLAYTHGQPASPTTMGHRIAQWGEGLLLGIEQMNYNIQNFKGRGLKGATGTQDSLLSVFTSVSLNEVEARQKLAAVEKDVMRQLGFTSTFTATGQMYPREYAFQILQPLDSLAANAGKFALDVRLLQSNMEVYEPFGKEQVGSSAMPHKRNPMEAERISALSKYVHALVSSEWDVATGIFLEGDVSNSAAERLNIPQAFLASDGIQVLYRNILDGMKVYPKLMRRNLDEQTPFIATQTLVNAAAARGGDRAKLHEVVRTHSVKAADAYLDGQHIDLLTTLKDEPEISKYLAQSEIDELASPEHHLGLAREHVDSFVAKARPVLKNYEMVLTPVQAVTV